MLTNFSTNQWLGSRGAFHYGNPYLSARPSWPLSTLKTAVNSQQPTLPPLGRCGALRQGS